MIRNAVTGMPVVIHGGDLSTQSMENEGACCQTRNAIHPLGLKISVPMATRVMPRSRTNPAQIAKMTSAALPRLSDGMESGDTCFGGGLRNELGFMEATVVHLEEAFLMLGIDFHEAVAEAHITP